MPCHRRPAIRHATATLQQEPATTNPVGMAAYLAENVRISGPIETVLRNTCGSNSSTCDIKSFVSKHSTVGAVQYAW
jgi:hypothetical protein